MADKIAPEQVAEEIEEVPRSIPQTATPEEQEAYLVLLRGKYTQFLNNNPSLQDPLVREQYKALGPRISEACFFGHTKFKPSVFDTDYRFRSTTDAPVPREDCLLPEGH